MARLSRRKERAGMAMSKADPLCHRCAKPCQYVGVCANGLERAPVTHQLVRFARDAERRAV
jgi:hypothetical protein